MDNKKSRKNYSIINIIVYVIIVIIWVGLVYAIIYKCTNHYKPNESLIVAYDLSKDLIPAPTQKIINKETFTKKINGVDVKIEKLATYDITGKVEATKDYSTSLIASALSFSSKGGAIIDKISPRDLTLSWGEIAKNEDNGHIQCNQYKGGVRYVMIYWDSYLNKKYGSERVKSQVSNNHIITLDNNLKNILTKVKVNDIVRIVGYLVYVECSDGTVWGPSSLTRTDDKCEIILADDIVIMPKVKK